jgi:hypothetical protein
VAFVCAAAHAAPPGFEPRDGSGRLVGPALVDAVRADWAARGRAAARAQNPGLTDGVDDAFHAASEIHAGATTPSAFREALGPLVRRAPAQWLALGALDEGDGEVELVATGTRPALVRALVDRRRGLVRAVVWVPLEPLPWSIKVSAGNSIEGLTYRFDIDQAGRLHYERITPTTWKPERTVERLLRPDERARLIELVRKEALLDLTTPPRLLIPDQGSYMLELVAGPRKVKVRVGMPPPGPATGEALRLARLCALLGAIVGDEVR